MSYLTTITAYWSRPEMLRTWLAALNGIPTPEIRHIVFFVGTPPPDSVVREYGNNRRFHFITTKDVPGDYSIGHYHNLGARYATTPWIMKLDVDTLPHVEYFEHLLPLLKNADPREWFNGGMMYVSQQASSLFLGEDKMPLRTHDYLNIIVNRNCWAATSYQKPAATNFICRRQDYLDLGGCDERFKGYGWEDYHQIYLLERHFLGHCPFDGKAQLGNITQWCRDRISRPKALHLYTRSRYLCLLHRWHPVTNDSHYRNANILARNRMVLFDCVVSYEPRTKEHSTAG